MTNIFICILLFITSCLVQLNASAAVLVKEKIWTNHTLLNVVFLDGNEKQKQLIQQYAPLWLEDSDLSFHFFNDLQSAPKQTHIRISFKSHTGSILGSHGDYSSKTATLVLAQLNQPNLSEEAKKRLVLHEFGHALGFEHEYRNPKWPYGVEIFAEQTQLCIPKMQLLDYDLVNAEKKCQEINQTLKSHDVLATVYDENSIMNYPLRIPLANNQFKDILAKSELSVLDKLAV